MPLHAVVALPLALLAIQPAALESFPAKPDRAGRYILYLHGRVMEEQPSRRPTTAFGTYEYDAILTALGRDGAVVASAVRPKDTDVVAYAGKAVADLQRLIAAGVPPGHIGVVGASKGSWIATLASSQLDQPEVGFVLLGTCTPLLIERHAPRISGRVLSIYESSDELGQSCASLQARGGRLSAFREIRLETGLKHGFLYAPLEVWVGPALDWLKGVAKAE